MATMIRAATAREAGRSLGVMLSDTLLVNRFRAHSVGFYGALKSKTTCFGPV